MEAKWLAWAKELQAIAQIGLTYSTENHFDVERYERIREIATEIMAAHSDLDNQTLLELFKRENGYATPKVDVRGVVFRAAEILLVKEREDNKWTLPGGWADVTDTPRAAVTREIREESGYHTEPVKLLAVYDRSQHDHQPAFPFHVYKLFILCKLVGGEATPSKETSEVGFFAENNLPDLSTSRVTKAQIKRMFAHHRDYSLATDFD